MVVIELMVYGHLRIGRRNTQKRENGRVTIDPSFKDSFVIKVGNGNNTLFWRDPWCSTGLRPMDIFPRLFALDTYKDCKVCDRWGVVNDVWGGMWSWLVPPKGRSLDNIRTLTILIGDLRLLESENDKWTWSSDVSGSFRVKTLTKKIERRLLDGNMIGEHHVWNSWIPRKVNICTWRASLNRLPNLSNLATRGVALPSSNCPLCNEEVESLEHCIINCPHVLSIWRKIWSWWNLVSPSVFPSFTIEDIVKNSVKANGCSRSNKALNGVLHCTIWSIWKWRNKVSHLIRIRSLRSLMKIFFPPFRGCRKHGYRLGLNRPRQTETFGFPYVLTFSLS
ncbi:RNA-directed DNA polymerase, eukaryota, reverse transcriptase zinc-binding domain protein [Tanacetum coccineum]